MIGKIRNGKASNVAANQCGFSKKKAPEPVNKLAKALTESDVSRVIEMAWEDRTAFEAIEMQFGLNQDGVIKLMRANLKLSSFKLWRIRTHGQKTKHLKLRSVEVNRHKANHRVKQF